MHQKLKRLERSLTRKPHFFYPFIASIGRFRQTALYELLKRSLDMILSGTALVVLSPLFLLVALLIYLENPGSVIFSQIRIGENGRPFKFYKFRSMVLNAEAMKAEILHLNESQDGVIFKSKKDPRITRVGRFIRRFSIDELPQLFNVFKGDMTLVGPRPPVPSEVALYTPSDRKRLHVKPGITCIWQVSGRSEIPFNTQVKMDLDYITDQSMKKDISLLFKTVKAVISGKGAY